MKKKKKTGYNQHIRYFAASKICIKNLLYSLNILLGAKVRPKWLNMNFRLEKKRGRKTFLLNIGKEMSAG